MICRATGILTASFAFFALAGSVVAHADEQRHHALSLIGEPQYGPDFKHFDWVNPDAPKGGTLRISAIGSFDSLMLLASREKSRMVLVPCSMTRLWMAALMNPPPLMA